MNPTLTEVFAGVTVSAVGASGTGAGMNAPDALELEPVPSKLVAFTVHVYAAPLVRPVTVIGLEVAVPVPVVPPEQVASKCRTGSATAVPGVNATSAAVLPAVTVTMVGAFGAGDGVTVFDGADGRPGPNVFVATTVHVYASPLVIPEARTGLDPFEPVPGVPALTGEHVAVKAVIVLPLSAPGVNVTRADESARVVLDRDRCIRHRRGNERARRIRRAAGTGTVGGGHRARVRVAVDQPGDQDWARRTRVVDRRIGEPGARGVELHRRVAAVAPRRERDQRRGVAERDGDGGRGIRERHGGAGRARRDDEADERDRHGQQRGEDRALATRWSEGRSVAPPNNCPLTLSAPQRRSRRAKYVGRPSNTPKV